LLIKREKMPDGRTKLMLKEKSTGYIFRRSYKLKDGYNHFQVSIFSGIRTISGF